LVRRFIFQCGIRDEAAIETFERLFDEFSQWCRHTDHWPLDRTAFAMLLKKIGLEPIRLGNKQQRAWRGFHIFTAQERQARFDSPYWPLLAPGQR
jgi:hypothetical protein